MNQVLERALAAEAAAERELRAVPEWLWDGESLPVPVDTIADSHYGLLVREEDELWTFTGGVDLHVSGLLFPSTREIWVDAEEAHRAPTRRRFTIGHEVGHWVLHCRLGDTDEGLVHCRSDVMREEAAVEEDSSGTHLADFAHYPPRELDANQFGAAVLMPASLVAVERERQRSLRKLSKCFGVSEMAMERRLWFLEVFEDRSKNG